MEKLINKRGKVTMMKKGNLNGNKRVVMKVHQMKMRLLRKKVEGKSKLRVMIVFGINRNKKLKIKLKQ